MPNQIEEWNNVYYAVDLQEFDTSEFLNSVQTPVLDEVNFQTTSPDNVIQSNLLPAAVESRGPPDRNAVETQYNFTVEIDSKDTKKKYLYSHRLNRIYVDKEADFSVQFNWESALGANMWVRACVVFADDAQAQKRPECCLQHLHQGTNTGVEKHIRLNVLHSSRPMGTQGVEYHGCAEAADSWLSTAVALTKPGTAPVAHAYKFVCKSSCSSGINRRAIAIIFTLENSQGTVFGRQMVGARVCCCPRRDIKKDEESEGAFKPSKRRVATAVVQPRPSKKIKVEPAETDERTLTLPPLEIVGERIAITGLEVMLSMTEQARDLQMRRDSQNVEKYDESIAKLKTAILDLKNKV